MHANTSQALKISGKQLPEWGFHQLEVVTDKVLNQEWTMWNVEEHRYTRSEDDDGIEKELNSAEMIPLHPTELGFFGKFLELQWKMLTTQHDAQMEHKFSSEPHEWLLLDRNIAYWISPDTNVCQFPCLYHSILNLTQLTISMVIVYFTVNSVTMLTCRIDGFLAGSGSLVRESNVVVKWLFRSSDIHWSSSHIFATQEAQVF